MRSGLVELEPTLMILLPGDIFSEATLAEKMDDHRFAANQRQDPIAAYAVVDRLRDKLPGRRRQGEPLTL